MEEEVGGEEENEDEEEDEAEVEVEEEEDDSNADKLVCHMIAINFPHYIFKYHN